MDFVRVVLGGACCGSLVCRCGEEEAFFRAELEGNICTQDKSTQPGDDVFSQRIVGREEKRISLTQDKKDGQKATFGRTVSREAPVILIDPADVAGKLVLKKRTSIRAGALDNSKSLGRHGRDGHSVNLRSTSL